MDDKMQSTMPSRKIKLCFIIHTNDTRRMPHRTTKVACSVCKFEHGIIEKFSQERRSTLRYLLTISL